MSPREQEEARRESIPSTEGDDSVNVLSVKKTPTSLGSTPDPYAGIENIESRRPSKLKKTHQGSPDSYTRVARLGKNIEGVYQTVLAGLAAAGIIYAATRTPDQNEKMQSAPDSTTQIAKQQQPQATASASAKIKEKLPQKPPIPRYKPIPRKQPDSRYANMSDAELQAELNSIQPIRIGGAPHTSEERTRIQKAADIRAELKRRGNARKSQFAHL